MAKSKLFLAIILAMSLSLGAAPYTFLQAFPPGSSPAPPAAPQVPSWPKVFDRNGSHIILYQPQLKSWHDYRTLIADTAISITSPGGKPILGVISWRADTITNVSARTVFIGNIKVLNSRFPSLDPAHDAEMQQRVHQIYPTMTFNIGLDRMIASLEKVNTPVQTIPASPEVPPIFVSSEPAIVLLVDGKPVLAPIQGLTMQYVVNTNWNLFYSEPDYYLLAGKTWLTTKKLDGRWSVTSKLPSDMSRLPADQGWADVKKAILPVAAAQPAPKVFFTGKPAELIAFKGRPVYAPIPGTSLSYATNTDNSVFLHKPDNQIYVLLSGRWFSAADLKGPWQYAGNDLPADFANIPPGHSYSKVLVSVPGTQDASDAVLLSQVPTTAIVNRASAEAAVKVSYAGQPQFVAIPGTTMFYAANTPEKVIQLGPHYYLCYQAIWFVSSSPSGPWKTADSVPQMIYTIPPSSPVYNVTYVVVSNPTPTTVETSYSSGYLGVFVLGMAVGATVVYGTGYYYPPYVYWGPHPIYYPYPCTYGVAAVYNPYTGAYGVGRAVYGPYDAGTAAWYNPATGTYGRAVTTQNAYGGRTYAQAYNPWTGTYAATSQGHNEYSQWGSSVVQNGNNWAQAQHVTNSQGTAGSFQTSKGSAGAGFSGANGNSGFVAKDANNNNVYAGADGNVYKKDSSGSWSKWNNGSWTPVDPSTGLSQTKNQQQNPNGSRQSSGAQSQNPSTAPASGSQPSSSPRANGNASSQSPNSPASRSPRAQPQAQTPNRTSPGASGSSDLGSQLQNDAGSRARGDQLERGRSGGGGGRRSGGGGRGRS